MAKRTPKKPKDEAPQNGTAQLMKELWQAAVNLRGSIEPIVASGSTVIAGLMCLLLSDLKSNSTLGPVASIGIVFSMMAALTLLPAMLFLLGRAAFWPRRPAYQPELVLAEAPYRVDVECASELTRGFTAMAWEKFGMVPNATVFESVDGPAFFGLLSDLLRTDTTPTLPVVGL